MNVELCPICDEGQLKQVKEKRFLEYKGHKGEVFCYGSLCDSCGGETATSKQMRNNKRELIAFKNL